MIFKPPHSDPLSFTPPHGDQIFSSHLTTHQLFLKLLLSLLFSFFQKQKIKIDPIKSIREMNALGRYQEAIDMAKKVAKEFQAACTPDFYLFNDKLKLFYRGRYDMSRPGNEIPLSWKDLAIICIFCNMIRIIPKCNT